ncbi:MAG: hypothetical protein E7355_05190 [Clostridiales bacterium]|nr:hypothetical protein [Clostridiales bacterium]
MKKEDDFLEEPTKEQENISTESTTAREQPPRQKKRKKPKWLYICLAISIGAACFCAGFFTHLLSLDKEFRELIKVKKKIQKEYYQDVTDEAFYNAVFQSVTSAKEAGSCQSDADFYKAVYKGINDDVLDAYSAYMTEEEYDLMRAQAKGKQNGIGVYFLSGEQSLKIYRVAGNSAAEEAGLTRGDTILAVGESVDAMQSCDSRVALSSFLDAMPNGRDFYMQWRTVNGEIKTAPLQKRAYIENYVYYKSNDSSLGFNGEGNAEKEVGTPLSVLDEDTAYIQIVQFNGNADAAFNSAMSVFRRERKKDLVIDLRGNGGGYLDVMQEIAKYFCKTSGENKPVAAIADYGEKTRKFRATDNVYYDYFLDDSRIMVLADDNTASASECLIGCMYAYEVIDYADICLVQTADGVAKTYGKGIMQTTFNILGGGAVKLTTAEIFWPTATRYGIHGVGITQADGTQTVSSSLSYTAQIEEAISLFYAE